MFYNVNIDRKLTLDYFPTRCFKGMLLSFLPFASTTSDQEPTCISTHAPSTNWTVWRVITYSEAKKQFLMRKPSNKDFKADCFSIPDPRTQKIRKKENGRFCEGSLLYQQNKGSKVKWPKTEKFGNNKTKI